MIFLYSIIKSLALENAKQLFVVGIAIAAFWGVFSAGERHASNEYAKNLIEAQNKALQTERKANEKIDDISRQYESDISYYSLYATDSDVSEASSNSSKHTNGCISQRGGISATAYNRKVILIHALDNIIDGYQREINH